jgi:hypothetical protein
MAIYNMCYVWIATMWLGICSTIKKQKKVLLVDVSVKEKQVMIFQLSIDIFVERTIYNMVRAEVATWCV